MNKIVSEKLSRIMGEALVRGKDRELSAKIYLLTLRLRLISLELDLFIAGGSVPGLTD